MQSAKAPTGLTNRFLNLFGLERKAASLASPDAALLELFGATPSASGVSITPRVALSCTPVRCSIEAISEAIGQLPLHVYKRGDDNGRERDPTHPAYGLLHDQSNDWTSASDFREQLTRDALLHGNGFAFINRRDGVPVELLRLNPENVTVLVDDLTGEPAYQISEPNGGKRMLSREDVLHIRAPSINGVSGLSPIQSCREAVGLCIAMETHAARLFGNGAKPSGLLSFTDSLKPEQIVARKSIWQAANAGEKSGSTAILDGGAKWQQITLSAVDAQFLELRQFQILEIARCFRIPPPMLMELGRATYNNSTEMRRQFLDFCLAPWLKRFESEFRLKLIAPEDRANYFCEFLVDDLLRTDIEKRADAYQKLIASRVLSPNEARAMENRAPYPEGDRFENPAITPGAPKNA